MSPILLFAAVVPAVFLLYKVYQADRLEREPIGLLIKLVFLGILSTVFALVVELVGQGILGFFFYEGSIIYNAIEYFIIVAFAEEGGKYIMLKLSTWKSKAFNCQFDGVVYAVFISLGFALWENIKYVGSFGLGTALMRAITAVPGHACFGVFMGVFYGIAKWYAVKGLEDQAKKYRRLALYVPAFIHGMYDFIASMETAMGTLVFVVFIVIMFVVAVKLVKTSSAHDDYLE